MSDPLTDPSPDDATDLPGSFVLGESGWEPVDYVEPSDDWRVTDDGSYESPDGRVRTRLIAEPAEWADVPRADEP